MILSMYKVKLSDIAQITMGQSPAGETCNEDGIGIPLLNGPAEFTNYYPIECQYTTDAKRLSESGDILFCVRGSTTGRMNWSDKRYAIGRGLAAITHRNDKELNFYIKYLIEHNLKALLNYANGSTFPNLTNDLLKGFELYVHDSKTIKKIAKVFSTLDAKIELNNRINTELEAMVKTLYDYWFVQFDFPDAKGKPYKTSGGKMVWNQEFKREIPEGWEVKPLSDINSLLARGISPKYVETDGIIVLNQKCIRNKSINFTLGRRHNYALKNVSSKLVKIGDVLVNSTGVGTLGRVALVKRLEEELVTVDSHVTIVRVDEDKANQLFIGYALTEKQNEIEVLGEGSTGQTELNRDNLGKLNLLLPPNNLQRKFEDFLKPQIQKIAINETENQQLSKLRDWLLPMLMNGQVTIAEAEEKVAMAAEPEAVFGKQGEFGF